jgi:hypothetical protein
MSTDLSWQQRSQLALTARAEKWEQSSWMQKAELPVVAITVPILVGLVVLLGNALALPLMLSLAVATILGLVGVLPFMLRGTHSFIPIETDGTPSFAPMLRAMVASNYSKDQDSKGRSGQMVNLDSDELEFLSELVAEYLEDNDDLNHAEFGFVKAVLDKIDEALND